MYMNEYEYIAHVIKWNVFRDALQTTPPLESLVDILAKVHIFFLILL